MSDESLTTKMAMVVATGSASGLHQPMDNYLTISNPAPHRDGIIPMIKCFR